MSLKMGVVGLPNVGIRTVNCALITGSHAEASNYPFCTIKPNVGIVEVPDERLEALHKVTKSAKIIPTVVEFVDVAGLVKNAHKGEGLGNQFLAHIRECDAIAMVVRFFEDEKVAHIAGKIDPKADIATVEIELQLADIAIIEKRIYNLERDIKVPTPRQNVGGTGSRPGGIGAAIEKAALDKILKKLFVGRPARDAELLNEEAAMTKSLSLLTMKPVLYIANCSEEQLGDKMQKSKIKNQNNGMNFIYISAKIESELNELSDDEKTEYLDALGISDTGINRLIKEAYKTLNLITFFTFNDKELRAWTVRAGARAPEAAGVIHSDFEKGFIAAEVIPWQDLYAQGGSSTVSSDQSNCWSGARAHGLIATCGKNYVVKDGDLMLFRFNV